MSTLRGSAPPSSGLEELMRSDINQLLLSMEDTATRYAVIIAKKWGWLCPPIDDLKAEVMVVMWESIIHIINTQHPIRDLNTYLRSCVFKQHARLVAHTLGYAHEYNMYQWMHHQRGSASYYKGVPPEETIEATDSVDSSVEDRRFLQHILEATNLKGIRKEIMQLVMDGMGPKEISVRLNKSIQLISWHKQQGIRLMSEFSKRNKLSYL